VKPLQKALLTKEQAEALESALECCNSKTAVIENHINGIWSGCRRPLSTLSLERLVLALYIGYEIERSREEKLLAYIQELHEAAEMEQIAASAKLVGVMKTLEILGIELKEEVKC
jgi:hypothetical protein